MEAQLARPIRRLRATARSAAPSLSARASESTAFPLGALMLAASVGSWAQTPPASESTSTLSTITVTGEAEVQGKDQLQTRKTNIGKGTQDIRDIPQSINVITEKLMDD